MKYCAFTICTGSYAGFATALRDSFLKYNKDFDFYIVFTDEITLEDKYSVLGDDVIAAYSSEINVKHLQFKYNIPEYATCLKPFSILYFFEKGYDKALYFDPDILFFSEFKEVADNACSVFLTPHMLVIPQDDDYIYGETNFLKYGTFNCGFVGFNKKEDSLKLVDWWARRLIDHSYADGDSGCYTDQKWMDLVPSLIESSHVCIIRNMGCDLASWNYPERRIVSRGDELKVVYRLSEDDNNADLIVFVHYSGYSFRRLLTDDDNKQFEDLSSYRDTDILAERYRAALKEADSLKYLSIPYKYSMYDNGDSVSAFHRRVFAGLLGRGYKFIDPFSCDKESFHELLRKKRFKLEKGGEYVASADSFGAVSNITRGRRGRFEPLLRFAFRVLGEKRYIIIIKALSKYTDLVEHSFLVKKK